jgi:hypothetical protein
VVKDGKQVKIWLAGTTVALNLGFGARELNEIVRKTRAERETFLEAWNEHFADRGA